jgi:hypothetical protein
MDVFERNFWVLLRPADDVPGQWTGHCLELDIVSAGTSLAHAIAMTAEAVVECVGDDLAHDRYPLDRRPAPAEFYLELTRLQRDGDYVDANDLPVDGPVIVAVMFRIRMRRLQLVERPEPDAQFEQLPPAWLIAKHGADRHLGA